MRNLFQILIITILFSGYLWGQTEQDCGFVAYYPFNGNANDETCNEKHGTIAGVNLTSDRFGNPNSAYKFDGVPDHDYILIPHSYFINFDGLVDSYAFTVWINSSNTGNQYLFLKKAYNGNKYPIEITNYQGNISGAVYDGINYSTVTYLNVLDGLWHFLAFVVDNSKDKIYAYIDASLVDSTENLSISNTAVSEPLWVGNSFNLDRTWDGMIDDIRVFSRALTKEEIDSLYHENGWTSIKAMRLTVPDRFELNQNYPNPFNPITKISYLIQKPTHIELKVFDINGREIRTLINEFQRDGQYSLDFNAENLASGIYTFRLKAGDFVETKKMTLVK